MTHRRLLEWVRQPSRGRGIHFAARGGDWSFWPYERLADHARRAARGLVRAGLREDGAVALIQDSGPEFVVSFFGTLLAGGVPAPMAPPEKFQAAADYRRRALELLRVARPALTVTGADPPASLRSLFPHAGQFKTLAFDELLGGEAGAFDAGRRPADLALLQFTSGSSGNCRAVRVPFDALEANVAAIHQWLGWSELDVAASWLPLHHDMGLIGCLISAVVCQSDLWLLSPEQFVRSPLRYVRCLGERGVSLTAMPNFGLDQIVRRVRPEALAGADFSALRGVIVGSEFLKAESFEGFYNLLAPRGLRRASLLPAYGLAEATLAVTGLPLREGWMQVEVDTTSVGLGEPVMHARDDSRRRATLIGCGRPLDYVSVAIESEAGQALPEGRAGQIVVRGSSVAAGYVRRMAAGETCFRAGALYTGDIGFMRSGQLFVLGRLGDSLKVRGRAVFAEDVESALARLGAPPERVAALLGWHKGEATALILLEHPASHYASEAYSILRPQVGEANLLVLKVRRGTIRRTTSGKVRRRELWDAFCAGGIEGMMGAEEEAGRPSPAALTGSGPNRRPGL